MRPALAFSEEIHPFLPPVRNRPDLFGAQQVLDEEDVEIAQEEFLLINALTLTLEELAQRIRARGGIPVPAHINRGNNGLLNALGFLPPDLPLPTVEVWRDLPCPADLTGKRILNSSDAHRLEDMLEREVCYPVEERTLEALFSYICGA